MSNGTHTVMVKHLACSISPVKCLVEQDGRLVASAPVAGVQPLRKLTLAGTSLLIGNCFTYL